MNKVYVVTTDTGKIAVFSTKELLDEYRAANDVVMVSECILNEEAL